MVDDESTGSQENLASIRDHFNFSFVAGSVADKGLVRRLLTDVDEVYHLAAAVGVQLISTAPIHTIETNIYPTELLLSELLRRARAGQPAKLFLASSSEVYGKNPKPAWNEEDDLHFGPTSKPRWAYGASKAIDEFLALAYHKEHSLPIVIGRFFNVVGPRQSGRYGMVLPRFVEAALLGLPLTVHEDGLQTRCFCHVLDVCKAIIALMDNPSANARIFNIGSDEPVTILDLAKRVLAATRAGQGSIEFQSYADAYDASFEDVRNRVPDLSRIRVEIGFEPSYTLDAVIAEVVGYTRTQLRRQQER